MAWTSDCEPTSVHNRPFYGIEVNPCALYLAQMPLDMDAILDRGEIAKEA